MVTAVVIKALKHIRSNVRECYISFLSINALTLFSMMFGSLKKVCETEKLDSFDDNYRKVLEVFLG